MIEKLKTAGIPFETGMTEFELDRAEAAFQFSFPKEIREFLSCGVPVGDRFFDFRDLSQSSLIRFQNFQSSIERSFRFDLENNREDMIALFEEKLGNDSDLYSFDDAVMRYLKESVRLIPFYGHRCFLTEWMICPLYPSGRLWTPFSMAVPLKTILSMSS